ncbi:hypothetical protein [Acuticoccus sp.]|uniref:hypothetical protein n=1 Tax=Acuticoccus sp. TaxID=1904378 RepID=UPI003B5228CA
MTAHCLAGALTAALLASSALAQPSEVPSSQARPPELPEDTQPASPPPSTDAPAEVPDRTFGELGFDPSPPDDAPAERDIAQAAPPTTAPAAEAEEGGADPAAPPEPRRDRTDAAEPQDDGEGPAAVSGDPTQDAPRGRAGSPTAAPSDRVPAFEMVGPSDGERGPGEPFLLTGPADRPAIVLPTPTVDGSPTSSDDPMDAAPVPTAPTFDVEAPADVAPASDVAVTRVTLATGGLAQVEGVMTAPAGAMRLAIERPQVADVLRTLVVTGPVPVAAIELDAAEPVSARGPAGRLVGGDLSDPTTVLAELIGEGVVLSGGANRLAGRLLAFTPVTIPGTEETPERPGLRIAVSFADGAVAYATFALLEPLSIEGDAVAEDVGAALPALAERAADDRRLLSVRLEGVGRAGFSFVVPTTVWRPSYRAIIGADGVTLQGWATLENTTGFDWTGITLVLSVGTPVAYRQDVYAPLRTERPVAPFAVGRTVETDIVPGDVPQRAARVFAAPAPSQRFEAAPEEGAEVAVADVLTGAPAAAGSAASVFTVAGAVDLDAGRTLTVPFLSGSSDVERVTYIDLAADGSPFDALQMTFDEAATVPGGLVAVYDDAGFVGDARFGGADGGETRILPFALSADVDVTTTERTRRTLVSASLGDGALTVRREAVTTTELVVEASEATVLVADLSRAPGAAVEARADEDLAPQITPIGEGRSRMRVSVPQGVHDITLLTRHPLSERYVVTDIPLPIVEEVLALGGRLEAETRERLTAIREATRRIAELERGIARREADVADLRASVEFDRENLEAIGPATPEGSEVRERIIAQTEEINRLTSEMRDLRAEVASVREALNRR